MGLEIIEFVMGVEEAFGIELPDEDVMRVNTVGEFHKLVQTKLGVSETQPAIVLPRAATDATPEALLELLEAIPPWPPPHRPIWDGICAVLIEQTEISLDLITPDARFVEDLDMG